MKAVNFFVVAMFAFFCGDLRAQLVSRQDVEKVADVWIRLENWQTRQRLVKDWLTLDGVRDLIFHDEKIGWVVDLVPRGFMLVPLVRELAPVKFISFSGRYDEGDPVPFLEAVKTELHDAEVQLGYLPEDETPPGGPGKQEAPELDVSQAMRNGSAWMWLLTAAEDPADTVWWTWARPSDPAMAETAPLAVRPGGRALKAAGPLLTSTWNQGSPYNLYTPGSPSSGEGHAWTGCVPTAMAQLMCYWKYPASGQGQHTYNWRGQWLSADFNREYRWDLMTGAVPATEEQIDAVARLMSDVGIAVEADYWGPFGTSAATNSNHALQVYFKYSYDISTACPTWDIMRNQVDMGWPMLATVCPRDPLSTISCHEVVVDGYREEAGQNQIHVNMGWGGLGDNYYTLDSIYNNTYAMRQALVNIHPPVCDATGAIAGRVIDRQSGQGLPYVRIDVFQGFKSVRTVWTDDFGNYTADCVPPGTYQIWFVESAGTDYYIADPTTGLSNPITVVAGQTVSGINATYAMGGSISGTIRNFQTAPVPSIPVDLYWAGNQYTVRKSAVTDAKGNYLIRKVEPLDYKVRFGESPLSFDYFPLWYRGKQAWDVATTVNIVAGQETRFIGATLFNAGKIGGTVVDAWGRGLANVTAMLFDENLNCYDIRYSSSTGGYQFGPLMSGRFKVLFKPSGGTLGYAWYSNKSSSANSEWVYVDAGKTTSGIDAMMTPGGSIAGRVTGPEGQGLASLTVSVYNQDKDEFCKRTATTGGDGNYTATGLPTGHFQVWVDGGADHVSAWYPSFVGVAGGSVTPGVDLHLAAASRGAIAGQVTNTQGSGVSSICVSLCDLNRNTVKAVYTNANGAYQIDQIDPGTYKVNFHHAYEYSDEWFNGKGWFEDADPVTVTSGTITIDTVMRHPGRIHGNVTATSGFNPQAHVRIFTLDNRQIAESWLEFGGIYDIDKIRPGTYKVFFAPKDARYVPEWYRARGSFEAADPVTVIENQSTNGIDAQLTVRPTAGEAEPANGGK